MIIKSSPRLFDSVKPSKISSTRTFSTPCGKNSQMNNKLLPYTISDQNGVYNKSKVKSNIEFPPLPDFLSPDGNNQPRSILYQKIKSNIHRATIHKIDNSFFI